MVHITFYKILFLSRLRRVHHQCVATLLSLKWHCVMGILFKHIKLIFFASSSTKRCNNIKLWWGKKNNNNNKIIDVLLMKTMNCPRCNQMRYRLKYVNGWHQRLPVNWLQHVNEPKKSQNFVRLHMQSVLAFLLIEFIDVYQVQRCFNFRPMLLKCWR